MEQAYIRGFIKEAQASGLTQHQAIELFKLAEEKKKKEHKKEKDESSYLGRYFAQSNLDAGRFFNNPGLVGLTNAATPIVGLSGMLQNRILGPDVYDRSQASIDKRTDYFKNIPDDALKGASVAALVAALTMPSVALPAAITGAVAGGVTTPLVGMLTKFINDRVSNASKQKALNMKKKHPYITQIPLGNVISSFTSL